MGTIANRLFEEHGIYKVTSNLNTFKIFIIEDGNYDLNGERFSEYINTNYISPTEDEESNDEEEFYLDRNRSYDNVSESLEIDTESLEYDTRSRYN